jgi:hypothetical protein
MAIVRSNQEILLNEMQNGNIETKKIFGKDLTWVYEEMV